MANFDICIRSHYDKFKIITKMLCDMSDNITIRIDKHRFNMIGINPSRSCSINVLIFANTCDSYNIDSNEITLSVSVDHKTLFNAVNHPLKSINIRSDGKSLFINDEHIISSNNVFDLYPHTYNQIIKIPINNFVKECRLVRDTHVAISIIENKIQCVSVGNVLKDTKKSKLLLSSPYGAYNTLDIIKSFDVVPICNTNMEISFRSDCPMLIKYNINQFAEIYLSFCYYK
jgi:hypothetical protein